MTGSFPSPSISAEEKANWSNDLKKQHDR